MESDSPIYVLYGSKEFTMYGPSHSRNSSFYNLSPVTEGSCVKHILNTLYRMSKGYLKRVYFKIPNIGEHRHVWNTMWNDVFNIQSEVR
jgi:hypothetical protein